MGSQIMELADSSWSYRIQQGECTLLETRVAIKNHRLDHLGFFMLLFDNED